MCQVQTPTETEATTEKVPHHIVTIEEAKEKIAELVEFASAA
jgi:hypothetical protein